jgi:hypothetical protein
MNVKDYSSTIKLNMVNKFKSEFFKKFNYYPTVIVNCEIRRQYLSIINLEQLKKAFEPFLPVIGKKKYLLETSSRKREIVELRAIYCFFAKKMGYSLKTIALSVNKSDHTTIIHNLKLFDNLINYSDSFLNKYNVIFEHIKQQNVDYNESPTMDSSDTMEHQS